MYKIDGFLFEDEKMAELAKKEEEAVSYLKEHTALEEIEGVYQLYTRLLEQKLFVTPVGIRFLTELQDILYNSQVPKETIPPILVESYLPLEDAQEETVSNVEAEQNATQAERKEDEVPKDVKTEETKTQKSVETQNAKTGSTELNKYKKAYHRALFFAIVFGLSVVGMFAILELSANNVTIINYRNEIIDEYSAWENNLKEKESMLKEWEAELKERESEISGNVAQ